MKVLPYILAGLLAFSFTDYEYCGKARWDVKNLLDADSKTMNYKAKPASIERLTRIIPKVKITNSTPRLKQEGKVYTVTCYIPEYRLEDDGDFHLILMDTKDSSITMVGEIPDVECGDIMADCTRLDDVIYSRNDFIAQFKMSRHRVQPGTYKVTGVFFFDKKHGQLGMAPNGAELHPILGIKKVK